MAAASRRGHVFLRTQAGSPETMGMTTQEGRLSSRGPCQIPPAPMFLC